MGASVERKVDLPASVEDVWEALTRPELLSAWFEADVTLDVSPGGKGTFVDRDGSERRAVVEGVEDGRRLSFRWWSTGGEASSTRVELVLLPAPGGTRLVVTEARLGATAIATATATADSMAGSWEWRMDLLALMVGALVRA